MVNIYQEEGEEFTENVKLRELFKRVQHPQLQHTVKALKVCFDMEGITYTQAANQVAAAVSGLLEYHLTRKVSASSSGIPRIRGGGGNNHNSNIKRGGGGGGDASPKQRRTCVRWIGFHRILPALVRTIKRRQAARVGFTKQEKEDRHW